MIQVCAAGGLVGYLTKVESRRELRGIGETSGLRVGGIESFTPCVLSFSSLLHLPEFDQSREGI